MRRRLIAISCLLLTAVIGCTGTGSIDSASDLGLTTTAADSTPLPPPVRPGANDTTSKVVAPPIEGDALYSDLPTGPKNTGTYPKFSNEPEVQITNPSQADTKRLLAEMKALNAGHQAGKISTVQYNQRLAILKGLASNHSPEMLKRIEAQSTF